MDRDSTDRAGVAYWDDLWHGSAIPRAVDPTKQGLWYHIHRRFDRFYADVLAGTDTRSKRLLEIGSARSVWLPYFAKRFGFEVTGLDYSERGAEQCRQVLANEGVQGNVVFADFRAPPEWMLGAFDVVTSYGVIEHFEDTASALQAAAAFLKPGGLLITVIPNMAGIVGWLQRSWNRPVYDIHVALDRDRLLRAHANAGLVVQRCEYSILLPFGVANLHGLPQTLHTRAKRFVHYWLQVVGALVWWVDERVPLVRPNRLLAGYLLSVARTSLTYSLS